MLLSRQLVTMAATWNAQRTAGVAMSMGLPKSDRWEEFLVRSPEAPPRQVLVLQKDEYAEWLTEQPAELSSYMAIAGLSKFKDGSLVLTPQERWVFMTKNASDLYAFSSLPSKLPTGAVYQLESSAALPATAALSWGLGCYSFDACKGTQEGRKTAVAGAAEAPKFASLVLPAGCDEAATFAALRATYLCRDLISAPASEMGPAQLESATRALAASHGATIRTVEGAELEAGYPQIHAVGRAAGASRQPRLIDLAWGDAAAPRVTLVGKGVCFDTGGLDIKPPAAMLTMKKDMGGAAHVLGLASMVMERRLPVRLRVLVAAVENAISADAMRPGDVLVARNGKTTEVGNTDAEGRLVLADALVEACREQPDLLVDCATLTGAGRVALGTDVPACFANEAGAEFADELVALSAREQDQVWRLPLWQGYREQIDSKVADLKNIGAGPYGGAITAALYLNEFVEPAPPTEGPAGGGGDGDEETAAPPPWLHLDMMAYNTGAKPGRPEGGEAMGMRALYRLLAARFGDE